MIDLTLIAYADFPRFTGWALLAAGLGTLAWAGVNWLTGEKTVRDRGRFNVTTIRKVEQPVPFHRNIAMIVFAGIVWLAASAYLLF